MTFLVCSLRFSSIHLCSSAQQPFRIYSSLQILQTSWQSPHAKNRRLSRAALVERWCRRRVLRTMPAEGWGKRLIHWATAGPVPLPL